MPAVAELCQSQPGITQPQLGYSMTATLELAKQLIQLPSITPEDCGCQQLIADRLARLGFEIESLPYEDVSNLWAVHGKGGPLFVFAGHTDVVPTGAIEEWSSDPFIPTETDGFLFGRGAADMKSSLAAMLIATERFLAENSFNGRIGFLITSDEEGLGINGTRKVIENLQSRGTQIDYCVVGEPSSSDVLGDTIKVGRRGSLNGILKVVGIEGHVAYPQRASNPIHNGLPALTALVQEQWDRGNDAFPPSSFQISNIHAGMGANNVIPESMTIDFNIRFSTESNAETLKARIEGILDAAQLNYKIDWHLSGEPFLTTATRLIEVVSNSVEAVTGIVPQQSTAGGTSDGRFIAPTGAQVVEIGPCNTTIHKVDECVRIADLEPLTGIYQAILENLSSA